MVNISFLGALAGCSARRSERRVASHTSEEQRRNAPARAAKNGISAFSASLSCPKAIRQQSAARRFASFKLSCATSPTTAAERSRGYYGFAGHDSQYCPIAVIG